MKRCWRLLEQDGTSAASGLAVDETLARRAGEGSSPATLRLYTYRSHCALVGRFQNLANEIHVSFCEDNGVELGRRPTGGGAIIMGAHQLGVALAVPGRGTDFPGPARDLMERFSRGLAAGLEELGITARFRGKNDLEVDGRKIAGLGIHRDASGGLLFHASLARTFIKCNVGPGLIVQRRCWQTHFILKGVDHGGDKNHDPKSDCDTHG